MKGELLLIRSGRRLCALNVEHVAETMRPLPTESLPDVPAFVRGVSVVRGKATPIVDLRSLLGDDDHQRPTRLVTLRLNDGRCVGLLVDEVLGIRPAVDGEALPPLLQDAASVIVKELTRLDHQLLTVLQTGRLLPDEIYERVEGEGVSSR